MRKTLALTLLAAGSIAAGSSTLCFAEEVANTSTIASPTATKAQPSQHEMDRTQQVDGDEPNQKESVEDTVRVDESVGGQTEEQPQEALAATTLAPVENAPSPSQRGMRQQIRDAQRNVTPVTAGQ